MSIEGPWTIYVCPATNSPYTCACPDPEWEDVNDPPPEHKCQEIEVEVVRRVVVPDTPEPTRVDRGLDRIGERTRSNDTPEPSSEGESEGGLRFAQANDESLRRVQAARIARAFHEHYERLAPEFGYETRKASAVPWEEVPDDNKRLMVATVRALLDFGDVFAEQREAPLSSPVPECEGG